jgi:hypothetical protein
LIAQISLPLFNFYLVNELGQSYYVDGNGLVKKSGLPRPLAFSPDGWEASTLGFERNLKKFGLVRAYSVTYGFVGDAAVILEYLYLTKNLDEKVWLLVQKLESEVTLTDYALVYKFYFKGEIDLSTYRKVRRKALANIMEGGRAKEIQANENTIYEMPLADDPDAITVLLDGIFLKEKHNFLITELQAIEFHTIPAYFISKEGQATGFVSFSQNYQVFSGSPPENNYLFITTAAILGIRIYGKAKFLTEQGVPVYGIALQTSLGREIVVVKVLDTANGQAFDIDFDVTFDASAGEKFWLVGLYPATDIWSVNYSETNFSIEFASRFKETYIKFFKPMDLFKRITEKVSGSRDLCSSNLLTGSGLCVTSGDAARGLAGAKIKTSLSAFSTAYQVIKCAGLGVESSKIVIELISHFLDDFEVYDLGDMVRDLEYGPFVDEMFSLLRIGYNDFDYDDVNGRFEFNTLVERPSPMKRVAKTKDLICPYRADSYGLEFTRINLDGKTTTDSSTDNACFIANVDLSEVFNDVPDVGPYYKLKRAAYTTLTGVPFPASAFNIEELTPERIFEAWSSFIRSLFKGYEGQKISYGSAKKNRELETTGGPGGDYNEDVDHLIGAMPAPLFIPIKLKVTAVGGRDLIKRISANPAMAFSFNWNGGKLKGFLLKCAVLSKTNQEQEFIFLSHIDNDLNLLKDG